MGHYFCHSPAINSQLKFSAFLGKNGYYVIKPASWKKYQEEVRSSDGYVSMEKEFKSKKAAYEWMHMFMEYPVKPIDLRTAKGKYQVRLRFEEYQFNYFTARMTDDDVKFSFKRIGEATITGELIINLFDCFLAASTKIGCEVIDEVFRVYEKPNRVVRFFTEQRSGDTLAALAIRDVLDVIVNPETIELLLAGNQRLSVGRVGCLMTTGHTF